MKNFVVAALYKFATLDDLPALQASIRIACRKNSICGTLLLAHEGINGTIAGTREGIDTILKFLRSIKGLADLEHKESFSDVKPFYRMKVRIKKEIVTMGVDGINPNEIVGTYLDPQSWNAVISDPETIVIDTRNDYEINIGTFKNAISPHTDSFRAFPDYVQKNLDPAKHKKVAMFCTGGIRCEKASAYMKKLGFEEVYHLQGGILKYLETMPEEKSLWQGDCFVFDQRVAVGHGLKQADYILCPSCRHPVSPADTQSAKYEEGVSCPACHDSLTEEKRAASRERHKQIKLAEERGELHIGAHYAHENGESG